MQYYEVKADFEGESEVLFGSFLKSECRYEIESERDSWKGDGYKKIKIVPRETADLPDPEVYKENIVTAHELFQQQAPNFNFEMSEAELVEHGLEVGYITKIFEDFYFVNGEYGI